MILDLIQVHIIRGNVIHNADYVRNILQ